MNWLAARFKPVMLVGGALTCTMIYAAIAPEAAMRSTFGEAPEGPVANLVVRSWGILVALVGVMLIYGAFRPEQRPLILAVAAASKLAFVALVLSHGGRYLGHQAGVAVVVDSLMAALFVAYLLAPRPAAGGR